MSLARALQNYKALSDLTLMVSCKLFDTSFSCEDGGRINILLSLDQNYTTGWEMMWMNGGEMLMRGIHKIYGVPDGVGRGEFT
jgi:hypothetical protein